MGNVFYLNSKQYSLNSYIFTINNTQKEFENRLAKKRWPVYEKTMYVDKLKKKDKILFYLAGTEMHKFAGSAVAGLLSEDKKGRFVKIDSIQIWKKPVEIKKIMGNLEIIKNPKYYGAYLAGGIKRLSEADYNFISEIGTKSL